MQKRNIVATVLLTIFTCGIYNLYWIAAVTNEIEAELGDKSDGSCRSGGLAILFSVLTCGIYMFYWYYKESQRIDMLAEDRQVKGTNEGWLYIVFSIIGLEIISVVLMQSDLNKLVDAKSRI